MMNINKETSILIEKGRNILAGIAELANRIIAISNPFLVKNGNPSYSLIPIKKDRKEFFRK